MSDDYEVGRGRPPKHTRFRKGSSGNPRGRPPRSRNIKKIVEAELDRLLPAAGEHGGAISARQLVVRGMIAKASKGDVAAAEWLVKYSPDEPLDLSGFLHGS